MAVLLGPYAPLSAEWFAARQSRLGGSEIAAVLGLSPWQSRFSLWHQKLGYVAPQADDPLLTAGRYLEPAIAQWWADQHPEFVVRETGTWVHSEREWQLANPDRLITLRSDWEEWIGNDDAAASEPTPVGILECKFSPYADGWGAPDTDDIPVYYRCQTLWYSDVFDGLPVHVAGLVDNTFSEWLIGYDPDDAQILRTAGAEFMATVEQQIRPDIDAHSQTYRILREQHPLIDPVDVQIDPLLAESYLECVRLEKEIQSAKRLHGSVILDTLGSARNAVIDGEHPERIAYRKANGDHPPYLCPDPKAVKARGPQKPTTIRGAA